MSDIGEFWKIIKEDQRKQRQSNREHFIDQLGYVGKIGFEVEPISEYQFRINDVLDIFPSNRKFHDLKNNKRGRYNDFLKFVQKFFKENT